MQTRLILGGPGSGKTTRLLDIMEEELQRGVTPERIAFVSFTGKAAEEAKVRASKKFDYDMDEFPYIRTLHSMCYRRLGVKHGRVMTMKDYKKIAQTLGVQLSFYLVNPDDVAIMKDGDKMIHFHNLARAMKINIKEVWEKSNQEFPFGRLTQWVATCEMYKEKFNKLDYTDMLSQFVDGGYPVPVEIAIIDEAQDLTNLQWDVVNTAFVNVEKKYIAGDDDQAIYEWAGADINTFLDLEYSELEVLPVSYRLPHKVFKFASIFADKFIKTRFKKDWNACEKNEEGFIKHIASISDVDLTKDSWFLLARNSCFLKEYKDIARKQGVRYIFKGQDSIDADDLKTIQDYIKWQKGAPLSMVNIKKIFTYLGIKKIIPTGKSLMTSFTGNLNVPWHECFKKIPLETRVYYQEVFKQEGILESFNESRIIINTIHSVKGGEADYVVINPNLTQRTYHNLFSSDTGADAEGRVFYVGATRAKKGVYILYPDTQLAFTGFEYLQNKI